MSKNLITVQTIAEMRAISKALQSEHNGFPVLNTAGNLVGLVSKNVLNELALQKTFYETRRLSIASRATKQKAALNESSSFIERLQEKQADSGKFDVKFDE